jgi:hypothetical protein
MLTNNGWGIRKLDDYGIIKFFNNELREGDRTKGGDQDFVYVITAGFLKIAKTEKNRNITGRLKSERKQKQKATSKSVEHEIWPIFFPSDVNGLLFCLEENEGLGVFVACSSFPISSAAPARPTILWLCRI